jgi:hypothetical protein
MFANTNRTTRCSVSLVAAVLGLGAWLAPASPAGAAPQGSGKMPVLQQVGYAGQLATTVNGQLPVTFRLFGAGDKLVYEETISADIHQGQFQVYVGGARGDLRGVLKDSQQMKVFFEGRLVDTLPVLHATQSELIGRASQHAVIYTGEPNELVAQPQALVGTCSVVQSGFFTIPFTNTTVGVSTPGCGGNFPVSGGYSLLTLPSQGVFAFGFFPVVGGSWQLNYQVGATAATLQTSTICCP